MREIRKGEYESAWNTSLRAHHSECRMPEFRSPLVHFLVHGLTSGDDLLASGGVAALEDEGIWEREQERETFNAIWEPHFNRKTLEGDYLYLEFSEPDLHLARPIIVVAVLAGWQVRLLSRSGDRSIVIDHDSNIRFSCTDELLLREFDWVLKVTKKWWDE